MWFLWGERDLFFYGIGIIIFSALRPFDIKIGKKIGLLAFVSSYMQYMKSSIRSPKIGGSLYISFRVSFRGWNCAVSGARQNNQSGDFTFAILPPFS
jgi:hypothetical protein